MSPVALLSWRVIAEIAMATKPEWQDWLAARQRSSSLLVSQFSLIKASRFVQRKLRAGPINASGVLERFAAKHLLPQSVIDARSVAPGLFNELANKFGKDDLEIFAICLAVQNRYEYTCWNRGEMSSLRRLDPRLIVRTFEVTIGPIHSSKP